MAQKRPPLPIFNKNKRPRQALVAHPNNSGGTQSGGEGQGRNYSNHSSFHSTSASAPYNRPRQPASSLCQRNSNYHTATGQENSIPAAAPYGSVTQNSQHGWQRESTYGRGQEYAMASSSWPKQHSQVGRSRFANQQPPAASTLTMQTPVPGSAVGTAKEPNRDMAAQHVTQGKASKRKPTQRILTATAQGMKHWSMYKNHTPLLFEVFGRLSSPTSLARDNAKCKQFQLSTTDGPVQCIFWEMAKCLPPLVQGCVLRVVGQWNGNNEVMQCYSVREAVSGEEAAARRAVETSDRSMRQFVADLNKK